MPLDLFNIDRNALLQKWGRLTAYQGISQWTSLAELAWLAEAASQTAHGIVGEIGSYKGKSAKALSIGNEESDAPTPPVVYCFDRFQDNTEPDFRMNMAYELKTNAVELFAVESSRGAQIFSGLGVEFDLFFIDGSHAKADVVRDIELWLRFVAPGGILAFHDCYPNDPDNGIHLALKEMLPHFTLCVDSIAAVRIPKTPTFVSREDEPRK